MEMDLQFVVGGIQHESLFPECVTLVDQAQGVGVFKRDFFAACASSPDRLLLLAFLSGELVGVATARVLLSRDFSHYKSFGEESVRLLSSEKQVGSMDCSSVREDWQGRGIGFQLACRRVAWLERKGCTALIGINWENGRRGSGPIFQRLGFKRLSRVNGFYKKPSLDLRFICPVCGPPPCHCAASLFVKLEAEHQT